MNSKNNIRASTFVLSLLCSVQAGVATADVAQSPLFVSAGAEPNVMLLIDNSSSMNNMLWPSAYDPSVTYTSWGFSSTDSNILYANLGAGSCSSGYIQGSRSNGQSKCLKLPSPLGGWTFYDGNYLNYLFSTYNNNTDLTGTTSPIPQQYRLEVAKSVATNLVNNTTGVRFGITTFNTATSSDNGPGGSIISDSGTDKPTLLSTISGLTPTNSSSTVRYTPLAETYYEITRYFRGMSRYQGSGSGDYMSPIQYRCQKNFAVVITDGLPTYDNTFPSSDPDDPNGYLPNWDQKAPAYGLPFSDGHGSGSEADDGFTLFLDDLAKFGYDIDMRQGGTDDSGESFDGDKFPQQNLRTYTVGFTVANQMLQDAAEGEGTTTGGHRYGHGRYYTASDSGQLTAALSDAVSTILNESTSAAAVATNSTRLDTDTRIYQARFNTINWSGQLLAYPINADGTVGGPPVDAGDRIPTAANRNIFTWRPATATETAYGTEFLWANLTPAQQTQLQPADALGESRLNYLRGDQSLEQSAGGNFRNRASLLGDIVNSNPVFAGRANFGYTAIGGTEGETYRAFRESSAYRNRPTMIYVGANDGMLHAFDASTLDERFAYVPNTVFRNLHLLTQPDYTHRYFVDGAPRITDAYVNGIWRTVLTGTLGAGGRGVFALDVTTPGTFDANNVMWEFPADPTSTIPQDADLGTVLGQAAVARLNSGQWVVIFGNGPGSTNQKAVLFILDLATGAVLKTIDTGFGGSTAPNGLSTPVPVDVNGDRITDVVYAGDLQGNMWKFDLTGGSSNWKVAYRTGNTPKPLFRALDGSSRPQAITVRPVVSRHPDGGQMVYFGTGRFFSTGDKAVQPSSDARNTFYAVRDDGAQVSGRSSLLRQTITWQGPREFTNGDQTSTRDVRTVSDLTPAATQMGWYLDLIYPDDYDTGYVGERVISQAVLHAGRIIFSTLIPTSDPCGFGGSSWLMELDAVTGSRLATPVFDLNGNGKFDANENYSGQMSEEGITGTPVILKTGGDLEYKYQSGTSGNIEVTVESADGSGGRQSWRQIQ
jgi:type IV pilus assembly protein PilY1